MDLRGWRWNPIGNAGWGLVGGAGVVVLAAGAAATGPEGPWAFRVGGGRGTRLSLVRETDGREILGVSVDWARTGAIEGAGELRWRGGGPAGAEVVDRDGRPRLILARDPDPATGADVRVDAAMDGTLAVRLATFAWLAVRHEVPGAVRVGAPRAVRRAWG